MNLAMNTMCTRLQRTLICSKFNMRNQQTENLMMRMTQAALPQVPTQKDEESTWLQTLFGSNRFGAL